MDATLTDAAFLNMAANIRQTYMEAVFPNATGSFQQAALPNYKKRYTDDFRNKTMSSWC